MRPSRALLILIVMMLISFLPVSISAGIIDPGFEEKLDTAPQGKFVNSIVMMADRINPQEMVYSIRHIRSLAERHTIVVGSLMDRARSTQIPLLQYLQTQKKTGYVSEYRPFWITNMVSVTATADVIREMASRFDVGMVFEDFEVIQMEPVASEPARSDLTGHEPGLEGIGATELWAMGITGEGVIVSNVDTGVDGNHEALADRWRGLDPGVDPSEAWFDPVTFTSFPFDDGSHGTHTMGTITGRAGADTIGVAPDAKWIAASCIDRVSGPGRFAVYASAIEWMADPDGDPGTFDDVPDVVSNSWGINTDLPACDSTFWEAIDNCEAAGAIVVFAAGNEGPYSASLRNPPDRNTTDVNVMAVGALESNQTSIASYSSRGPSTCDYQTIKPEVCAQGSNVRSSVPNNGYASNSGTSMACPHVAGAIALLRQVDPNATPEEVKTAILLTATDLGVPGEDNDYGMGRVNLVEAANYLGGLDELYGTVTDAETGYPLRNALVELPEIDEHDSTDGGGHYRFRMILPDTLLVITSKFGYEIDSSVVVIEQDTMTIHNVALIPSETGTIEGTVTDIESGEGIAAEIEVSWLGIGVGSTSTDPVTGFYSIDLPAGFYDVTVTPESPYIGETVTDVEVIEHETTILNFAFQSVTVFNDVSSSSGIEMMGYGQGCAWGDFDGDGDEDIYVTNLLGANRLFRNDSGSFTDVAAGMGVADAGDSFAACWGDFDRDFDLDLFVSVRNAANRLYRNDGSSFTDVAASVGLTEVAYSQGAAWLDYNMDGWTDLFVVNRNLANRLYKNDSGVFVDVTEEMGFTDSGISSGLGVADFDGDRDPDILVLHKGSPNVLFRNDRTVFTDVTAAFGVGGGDAATNGCAWGDFDNDGDFDLYVCNSSAENMLFRNDGSTFEDISASSGTASEDPGFQAIWMDFDSDGDQDLFVASSTTSSLYYNTGGGKFIDVADITGTDVQLAGGAAAADFDGDGRLDLYIVRSNNQDDVLLQNNGNLNTWLNITLRGSVSDHNGIGAKVRVTSRGKTSTVQVAGGNGYFSQDSFTLHFGLARESRAKSVTVLWPNGKTSIIGGIAANQKLTIVEPLAHNVPNDF